MLVTQLLVSGIRVRGDMSTSRLQMGQHFVNSKFLSTQSLWKRCLQGSLLTTASCCISSRQITHELHSQPVAPVHAFDWPVTFSTVVARSNMARSSFRGTLLASSATSSSYVDNGSGSPRISLLIACRDRRVLKHPKNLLKFPPHTRQPPTHAYLLDPSLVAVVPGSGRAYRRW